MFHRSVPKSGGQESAPDGADMETSADPKLGPDDGDKSASDASAQASVGGADVVEPPVGGRVSDSPQPEHEVNASDDDEVEYVETKKPQFGPADDVEVLEVGSDPDDEVELVKVEPAVKKEVHLSTVQEDQVLKDMELSSLKGTPPKEVSANFKCDWPQDHLDSSSYLSAVLTTSEYLRKRTSMEAEADAWIDEMELTRRTFGAPGDWTAMTIHVAHFSPRECVAVLRIQLFESGFGFLSLVPGWFRTRANKAHPDLIRNVVEEMLILLTIEMVELRQLAVQAAGIQVSARAKHPRPERSVLEPDVEMSDRDVELFGCDYARMLKVSGLQKPRSPRGPSVGEPGPKRIQRVPALAPPSSIPTPESPQSGLHPPFEVWKARDREGQLIRFSWGRDAGGRMPAVPMAMTARTLGGETAVGPAIAMYVTQETLPSNLGQVDHDDATMSEYSRSQARGRKSMSSRRRSKRASPSPSGSSSSEEIHRRRGSSRRSPSERSYSSGRSRASVSSGSTQVALNAMYQVQEAVARMETRQDSALEKLNATLDLEVARRFGPRAQGASEKREDAPDMTDDARVHREAETQEAARLEAVRLVRERADALLAQYRAQPEAHQADEARRVTAMVESMRRELEDMRLGRARERETAKNIQTFLGELLRNIRTTFAQTTPRPVTSQPDLATSRPILYPESSGVIYDDAIKGKVRRPSTNLDELLAAQLRATLDVATKTGAVPPRVKVESPPEAPARKRPDVRSEQKAATEGEMRHRAQPDVAKRAKSASAKSAERKGRDASSQNNKSKKTPKHRDSSDKSDSNSSSGSSDQDSDHSDSSSFEDVVPNVPILAGPGGTMFTF
ncbi:unnamed protein product [Phytophthora fragariaefolia]|uniref:Unnamed protein product n=1 Tax=Phytophthora fragariaefolia TaxID=1490495 RepID=A0A9W7CLW4_9STRA|nr:unnamed protein product [Phytophthora fragariaefolia]